MIACKLVIIFFQLDGFGYNDRITNKYVYKYIYLIPFANARSIKSLDKFGTDVN